MGLFLNKIAIFETHNSFYLIHWIEFFSLIRLFSTDMSTAGILIDIGGKIEDKTVEVVVLGWTWIETGDMNGEVREQAQILVGK